MSSSNNVLTTDNAWILDVPSGWTHDVLSNLLEFVVDNRGKTPPTIAEGIPLIGTYNINDTELYPDNGKLRYISQETFDTWFRSHPEPGDIIITNKGEYRGSVCYVPDPVWFAIAQDMVALRADKNKIYPPYLLSVMRSPYFKYQVQAFTVSTTIPHLRKTDFDRLIIPIPSMEEQVIIGDLYFTLSDKIEANRRENETLEAMARAIFKSWFVDFDPVHAKANGEQPYGMDAETAALFPDDFENSELGMIPRGWSVGEIDDILDLRRDSVKPQNMQSDLFYHYSIPAYNDGLMPRLELGETIRSNKYKVIEDSILLSKLNPRFKIIWFPELESEYQSICSTEFLVSVPRERASQEFLYCLFQSHNFYREFEMLVTGTSSSHQRIKPQGFMNLDVVIPCEDVVNQFTDTVRPFFRRIANNRLESRTLAETRDALLPRLISGELRVGEV